MFMNAQQLIQDLEAMVDNIIPLPIVKGNSIRIKHMIVRKTKNGYSVFNCKSKEHVADTTFKKSAIAIAKTSSVGANYVDKIVNLDRQALKHHNDITVYQHTVNNSKQETMKMSRQARLTDSIVANNIVAEQLENFIYDDKYI